MRDGRDGRGGVHGCGDRSETQGEEGREATWAAWVAGRGRGRATREGGAKAGVGVIMAFVRRVWGQGQVRGWGQEHTAGMGRGYILRGGAMVEGRAIT